MPFLQKNVYSVFRYDPPSVGFAELSSTVTATDGNAGLVPSPTIGSPAAIITVTSVTGPAHNRASRSVDLSCALSIALISLRLFIGILL